MLFVFTVTSTSCAVYASDVGLYWRSVAVPKPGTDGLVGPTRGRLGRRSFAAWPNTPDRGLSTA